MPGTPLLHWGKTWNAHPSLGRFLLSHLKAALPWWQCIFLFHGPCCLPTPPTNPCRRLCSFPTCRSRRYSQTRVKWVQFDWQAEAFSTRGGTRLSLHQAWCRACSPSRTPPAACWCRSRCARRCSSHYWCHGHPPRTWKQGWRFMGAGAGME